MDPTTIIVISWIVGMLVFYLIIKAAVRNGIIEAHKIINKIPDDGLEQENIENDEGYDNVDT